MENANENEVSLSLAGDIVAIDFLVHVNFAKSWSSNSPEITNFEITNPYLLSWRPTGRYLAALDSYKSRLGMYQIGDETSQKELESITASPLAWHPTDDLAATAAFRVGPDKEIHDVSIVVADIAEDAVIARWEVPSGSSMRDIDSSPDGRWIAAGFQDGSVAVVDTASGAAPKILIKHRDAIAHVRFSPDSQRLISQSSGRLDNNNARIYELRY